MAAKDKEYLRKELNEFLTFVHSDDLNKMSKSEIIENYLQSFEEQSPKNICYHRNSTTHTFSARVKQFSCPDCGENSLQVV